MIENLIVMLQAIAYTKMKLLRNAGWTYDQSIHMISHWGDYFTIEGE